MILKSAIQTIQRDLIITPSVGKERYKDFSPHDILPERLLAEPIGKVAVVANWIDNNKIEGEYWELANMMVLGSSGEVVLTLKRKNLED